MFLSAVYHLVISVNLCVMWPSHWDQLLFRHSTNVGSIKFVHVKFCIRTNTEVTVIVLEEYPNRKYVSLRSPSSLSSRRLASWPVCLAGCCLRDCLLDAWGVVFATNYACFRPDTDSPVSFTLSGNFSVDFVR